MKSLISWVVRKLGHFVEYKMCFALVCLINKFLVLSDLTSSKMVIMNTPVFKANFIAYYEFQTWSWEPLLDR